MSPSPSQRDGRHLWWLPGVSIAILLTLLSFTAHSASATAIYGYDPARSSVLTVESASTPPLATVHGTASPFITLLPPLAASGVGAEEVGGSSLTSGWRGTNMSDEESFNYHYAKHGGEQYAQDARNWAANPTGTGTPVGLADGTTGMRYRTPGGGPGGILDSGGNIVTFWYR